eukprot:scaffold211_cov447-Prasinococcus_capsulatus_cf.AAC.6
MRALFPPRDEKRAGASHGKPASVLGPPAVPNRACEPQHPRRWRSRPLGRRPRYIGPRGRAGGWAGRLGTVRRWASAEVELYDGGHGLIGTEGMLGAPPVLPYRCVLFFPQSCATVDFRKGDRVAVLVSRGRNKCPEVFAIATLDPVQSPEADSCEGPNAQQQSRLRVVYQDGSSYHCRPERLIHLQGSLSPPQLQGRPVLVCNDTHQYRRAGRMYVEPADTLLELGCDFGPTVLALEKHCDVAIGVDKNKLHVAAAEKALSEFCHGRNDTKCSFHALDIFLELKALKALVKDKRGPGPLFVMIDINGNRPLDIVAECLELVCSHFGPRMVIVKSMKLWDHISNLPVSDSRGVCDLDDILKTLVRERPSHAYA